MTESINEFYSYSIEDLTIDQDQCFQVIGYDENQNSFVICTTKDEKIAQHLIDSFDCLAMDEEKELFKGVLNW